MFTINAADFNRIAIPKLFYDSLNNAPFTNCLVCNRHLTKNPTTYLIEKAFRKNPFNKKKESVFEYAICWDCIVKLTNSYSTKSKSNINDYFSENIDFRERDKIWKDPVMRSNPDLFLSNCAIKGTSVNDLNEYQIMGYFYGNFMTTETPPFMFGGTVAEEIMSVLSEQTLGELDDFTGKYLTGPPEFSNFLRAPKRKPVILL